MFFDGDNSRKESAGAKATTLISKLLDFYGVLFLLIFPALVYRKLDLLSEPYIQTENGFVGYEKHIRNR